MVIPTYVHFAKPSYDAPNTTRSESPSDRLKQLRIGAGHRFAAQAAEAMRRATPQSKEPGAEEQPVTVTYQHHENGRRQISRIAAARYAAYYEVPISYIMCGDKPIPITGAVQEGGKIAADKSLPRSVVLPGFNGDGMAALVVTTDDLAPAYRSGDVVFYKRRRAGMEQGAEGAECVVETADGDRLLCVPSPNSDETWYLVTYNGGPPRRAQLKWAALVRFVAKKGFEI